MRGQEHLRRRASDFLEDAQCFNIDTGEVSGSYFRTRDDHRQRLTVRSDATVYGGRFWGMQHQFKFGVIDRERALLPRPRAQAEHQLLRLQRLGTIPTTRRRDLGDQKAIVHIAIRRARRADTSTPPGRPGVSTPRTRSSRGRT